MIHKADDGVNICCRLYWHSGRHSEGQSISNDAVNPQGSWEIQPTGAPPQNHEK